MKKFLLSLMAAVIAAPIYAQSAAPARVAVVNVPKVLAESTSGKAAYERLKKMQEERAVKAQKLEEELKGLDAQINQKKLSLTDDKLIELRKDFDGRKIAAQRFMQDADRELTEARDKSLQELEKQLIPVINEVGKEMGFAAIFNKFESGLVYASDAIDVTEVIVKRFNERVPASAAAKK